MEPKVSHGLPAAPSCPYWYESAEELATVISSRPPSDARAMLDYIIGLVVEQQQVKAKDYMAEHQRLCEELAQMEAWLSKTAGSAAALTHL